MAKVIVVGGVAGGATAASQLRRLNQEIDITIYEKDRDISFANCGLPYHIGGEVDERRKLIAATPESFNDKGVSVFTYHEVVGVNAGKQFVTVKNMATGEEFNDTYDYLILSPGGRARVVSGLENVEEAFSLHNIEDMDRIIEFIDKNKIQEAVIVGTGFIGMEMAENLRMRDIGVTVVHRNENI